MGAEFRVLSRPPPKGATLPLHLQELRNRTTVGRVFLQTDDQGVASVLKEAPAPRSEALDGRLAALGDRLQAVTDQTFVKVRHVGRSSAGATVGLLSEYVEGRFGVAPELAALRVRVLQRALVHGLHALRALHRDHGLVHGDLHPGNLLLGALGADGTALPLRILDLGTGEVGTAVVAAGGPAFARTGARLGSHLVCTATAWGTPGYCPLGRFEEGAAPTPQGDLLGLLLACWELLVGEPLAPRPREWDGHNPDALRAVEASLRQWRDDPQRGARVRQRVSAAIPSGDAEVHERWSAFFEYHLTQGLTDPEGLDGIGMELAASTLPEPFGRASTLPEPRDAPPAQASAPVLSPGDSYTAEVVLDAFSTEEEGPSREIRFRHVAMLGEGAMGSVHRVDVLRGKDTTLPAALKITLDESDAQRDALVREAHVLRARSDEGVARFLALVELPGGALALLMAWQGGTPLDVILQARTLSPPEALALGRRLLDTLSALHAHDDAPSDPTEVVHGDIKPGNIIVPQTADGAWDLAGAVLIDFGVARLRRRLVRSSLVPAGGDEAALGGTVGYMPVGHLERGATAASDVFAVAVVLCEALTGRRPWTVPDGDRMHPVGHAFSLQERMRATPPRTVSWREVRPWQNPGGWRRFLKSTLAQGDPDRIPSAREALQALEALRRDRTFPVALGFLAALGVVLGAHWLGSVWCPSGQVRCQGACTALNTSLAHCGACGVACGPGERCEAGQCAGTCPPGQVRCGEACIDRSTDRQHCGACGVSCGDGEVCSAGACTLSCGAGLTHCSGSCRDLQGDRAHCGACGRSCAAGQVCSDGRCQLSCAAGLRDCSGSCRDLATDRAHCGRCGAVCASGAVCSSGRCVTSCGSGTTDCGGSCRDLATDRAHCGACTVVCAPGEACVGGRCVVECGARLTACEGRCRDTHVDPAHCGACGRACAPDERCREGQCRLECAGGLTLCEGQCRDTRTDEAHCGGCDRGCGALERCQGGGCVTLCAPPLASCGGQCRDVRTDEAHCGGCDHGCDPDARCEDGRCHRRCPTGLAECGGRCVDTDGDRRHCGACDRGCAAGEACASGQCRALATRAHGASDADAGASQGAARDAEN
ncbi:MAG: phosphotransferase [Deltaproteobacteria bacterium]|nr:phosphotransferase [Deltaproteobacteria bacterium]